jgi:simple sugar transport system permease protein
MTDTAAPALDPRLTQALSTTANTISALLLAALLFSAFLLLTGYDPLAVYALLWKGAFGSAFAWQNTLQRAAPLMLTALCVALPARAGLIVIGGEGAVLMGGLAAAALGASLSGFNGIAALMLMGLAGALAGGLWIGLVGLLREKRGVNEAIGSLLLAYIAAALFNHLVEGALRDPASLNKPSTPTLPEALRLGELPGIDVHGGLAIGMLACVLAHLLIHHTPWGFSLKVAGGNPRAGRLVGLPVGGLAIAACALGGAAAGLAGMVEVTAVHGSANSALAAGYGYAGILVAFVARQQPLAILPTALLVGGVAAAGGLLQRRLGLPDATVNVLQGFLFLAILVAEPLFARLRQLHRSIKR